MVLRRMNCYSFKWCYTQFAARLWLFKRFQKALRAWWLFDGSNTYIQSRSVNIFISSALATSQGSCLVSWLYINKLSLKYIYLKT